jgi:prevent-host-death family protein
MGKIMPMKELVMPIGKARSELCDLVKQVQAGARVTLTSHGRPCAMIVLPEKSRKPQRVAVPSDPKLFGDLQSPVMEPWK